MRSAKITVSLDEGPIERIDRIVAAGSFPSRSRAIEVAVRAQIDRLDRSRLALACAKLDATDEKALAEESADRDLKSWLAAD